MAKKTYVPSTMRAAYALCRIIGLGTPLMTRLYGSNTALMAALAAANSACATLHAELAAVREYGD
jgi:uncharacterized membrane protein